MIYEFRTYDLTPRTLPQYDSILQKSLAAGRLNYSPLFGYFYSEFGPLNQALHIWPYKDLKERTEIREQVTGIARNDQGLFDVQTSKGRHRCQKVILAIGKRGTPRRLEVPGAELTKVMYSLTDAAQYQGARILVIGGGNSAAEAALGLSNQDGNLVTLSYRKPELNRLKDKNKLALKKAFETKLVRFLPASQVVEIKNGEVVLQTETGANQTVPNDYVFALIGGTTANAFLKQIGIDIVTKEVSMQAQKIPA